MALLISSTRSKLHMSNFYALNPPKGRQHTAVRAEEPCSSSEGPLDGSAVSQQRQTGGLVNDEFEYLFCQNFHL